MYNLSNCRCRQMAYRYVHAHRYHQSCCGRVIINVNVIWVQNVCLVCSLWIWNDGMVQDFPPMQSSGHWICRKLIQTLPLSLSLCLQHSDAYYQNPYSSTRNAIIKHKNLWFDWKCWMDFRFRSICIIRVRIVITDCELIFHRYSDVLFELNQT